MDLISPVFPFYQRKTLSDHCANYSSTSPADVCPVFDLAGHAFMVIRRTSSLYKLYEDLLLFQSSLAALVTISRNESSQERIHEPVLRLLKMSTKALIDTLSNWLKLRNATDASMLKDRFRYNELSLLHDSLLKMFDSTLHLMASQARHMDLIERRPFLVDLQESVLREIDEISRKGTEIFESAENTRKSLFDSGLSSSDAGAFRKTLRDRLERTARNTKIHRREDIDGN